MQSHRSPRFRRLVLALVAVGAVSAALLLAVGADASRVRGIARTETVELPDSLCGPAAGGQPPLLKLLVAAKTEQSARAAFDRAWFGVKEGPNLSTL